MGKCGLYRDIEALGFKALGYALGSRVCGLRLRLRVRGLGFTST